MSLTHFFFIFSDLKFHWHQRLFLIPSTLYCHTHTTPKDHHFLIFAWSQSEVSERIWNITWKLRKAQQKYMESIFSGNPSRTLWSWAAVLSAQAWRLAGFENLLSTDIIMGARKQNSVPPAWSKESDSSPFSMWQFLLLCIGEVFFPVLHPS